MEQSTFELTAGRRMITVAAPSAPGCPIVYLNTVQDEGEAVRNACLALRCPPFTLAAISGLNWDHDLSPWAVPPISKNDEAFTGGAEAYLRQLTEEIIPAVEGRLRQPPGVRCLAGYSLAGLFAVYALYHTTAFSRAACASGSFWFPGFVGYAGAHPLRRTPDRLCFSLGDREAKTRNPILRTVEENTRTLCQHYAGLGIKTTFTLNPGSHFTQPNARMAADICRMLSDQQMEGLDAKGGH